MKRKYHYYLSVDPGAIFVDFFIPPGNVRPKSRLKVRTCCSESPKSVSRCLPSNNLPFSPMHEPALKSFIVSFLNTCANVEDNATGITRPLLLMSMRTPWQTFCTGTYTVSFGPCGHIMGHELPRNAGQEQGSA